MSQRCPIGRNTHTHIACDHTHFIMDYEGYLCFEMGQYLFDHTLHPAICSYSPDQIYPDRQLLVLTAAQTLHKIFFIVCVLQQDGRRFPILWEPAPTNSPSWRVG